MLHISNMNFHLFCPWVSWILAACSIHWLPTEYMTRSLGVAGFANRRPKGGCCISGSEKSGQMVNWDILRLNWDEDIWRWLKMKHMKLWVLSLQDPEVQKLLSELYAGKPLEMHVESLSHWETMSLSLATSFVDEDLKQCSCYDQVCSSMHGLKSETCAKELCQQRPHLFHKAFAQTGCNRAAKCIKMPQICMDWTELYVISYVIYKRCFHSQVKILLDSGLLALQHLS